jgi:putative tryptophan/tyrosine transport system substrate-binding protein
MLAVGNPMQLDPLKRREFIALLGGAAASWPLAAHGQQPAMPVIGFLHPATAETSAQVVTAFRQGLGETGYAEGRNAALEFRWADGRNDRLPALAAELVGRRVAVIAAPGGDSSAFALKAATATIPIVSAFASDPVKNGLIAGLNRPGGNLTGIANFGIELMPKRLALLCEAMPNAAVIDMLVNPEGAITAAATAEVEAAARLLARQVRIHMARNEIEVDAAFTTMARLRASALLVMGDSFFASRAERIGALTMRVALPAMFPGRDFVAAGGLMSYDTSRDDVYRLVGTYTGRILKGDKAAELPVQQPTKFELVINLKTAKVLGSILPSSLLAVASEVIE